MTEGDLTSLLRKRYAAPEWAFLPQVRNGVGFSRRTTRTADALALSLYPSRGIHLHGFEIKVSKSDFKKEIQTPEKAEEIARFCNAWWIVAPDQKVAPLDLVPANWGLLTADGDSLTVARQARVNDDALPIDRPMLAAILRRVTEATNEMVGRDEINQLRSQIRAEVATTTEAAWRAKVDALTDAVQKRDAELAELCKAIGCSRSGWDMRRTIRDLKVARMLSGDVRAVLSNIDAITNIADRLKLESAAVRKEIEAALSPAEVVEL